MYSRYRGSRAPWKRAFGTSQLDWKPVFGDKLLDASIGRGLGVVNGQIGLSRPVVPILKPLDDTQAEIRAVRR